MDKLPENKEITLTTDYEKQNINMDFSDNLIDDREKGYILSAAFFAYAASQGLDKDTVLKMVNDNYEDFLKNKK